MTIRTWIGGTGRIRDPEAWTPSGSPVSGDVLLLPTGTAFAKHQMLNGLSIAFIHPMSSSDPVPVLAIKNVTLSIDSRIIASNVIVPPSGVYFVDGRGRVEAYGHNTNHGTIMTSHSGLGSPGGSISLHLNDGIFVNDGLIRSNILSGISVTSTDGAVLKNNGIISTAGGMVLDAKIIGEGIIRLGDQGLNFMHGASPVVGALTIDGFVGKHQTVEILTGGRLTINDVSQFHATIKDFNNVPWIGLNLETITLKGVDVTSFSYRSGEGQGVLTLRNGCEVVGKLAFVGDYTQSSFQTSHEFGNTVLTVA